MGEADYFASFAAAASLGDPTVSAGRHSFQREGERQIVADIASKLRVDSSDRLLEIGCGTGNLLGPLSERVQAAVGLDHGSCLTAFQSPPANVDLIEGRWPEAEVEGDFSKILVYSVLHYLENALAFIDPCLDVLRPGGRLLLGDLPNSDAAARFSATEFGQRFSEEWARKVEASKTPEDRARDEIFAAAPPLERYIDDAFLVTLFNRYRGLGHEVYILPQPPDLPFAYTREDVLIVRRPR